MIPGICVIDEASLIWSRQQHGATKAEADLTVRKATDEVILTQLSRISPRGTGIHSRHLRNGRTNESHTI